ncbi:MAG: ComF family protein [Thermodesulfobacteriota bacterium]|nr:ComF family protein [Thermodesulfobacteriota bacterium]
MNVNIFHTFFSTPKFFSSFLNIFYPVVCVSCGTFLNEVECSGTIHLCGNCSENIAFLRGEGPLCDTCGYQFDSDVLSNHLCGKCIHGKYHFHIARSLFSFEGLIRDLILRLKYQGEIHVSKTIASLMCVSGLSDFMDFRSYDFLVPIPLHLRKLRERGFNQSLVIAKDFIKICKVPLFIEPFLLKRIRWTAPQAGLKEKERERNVSQSFSLVDIEKVKRKSILLFDDVYTTGATVSECSRVLIKAGAKMVGVLTIARAR